MSMHTDGPWKCDWTRSGKSAWKIVGNDKFGVATILATQNRDSFEKESNALLIASAPELLEALQAILPFIPITSAMEGGASAYSENVRAADKVRAAIAKATGAIP